MRIQILKAATWTGRYIIAHAHTHLKKAVCISASFWYRPGFKAEGSYMNYYTDPSVSSDANLLLPLMKENYGKIFSFCVNKSFFETSVVSYNLFSIRKIGILIKILSRWTSLSPTMQYPLTQRLNKKTKLFLVCYIHCLSYEKIFTRVFWRLSFLQWNMNDR